MKNHNSEHNLPEDKEKSLQKAKHLEWASIFFMLTIILVLAFTMGASQTMKAMWVEDVLSLIPMSVVLIGIYFRKKQPNERFPYGYRRGVQVCFLAASVALLGFGAYILIDSIVKLIMAEHPSIQTIEIFGSRIWLGWLMIAALIYSVIPPFILGQMKLPLSKELHDKALYTSATTNKGDWLSGIAAVLGILGIAYGYWWADSVAAGFISFEIVKDGFSNLKNSIEQLMNKRPTSVEKKEKDPIVDKVQKEIDSFDWVKQARVRLREEGDVFAGEAFVVPTDEQNLMEKLKQAGEQVKNLDWRIYDFNIVPVRSLE